MHILGNRTSLDKYVLNGILKHKILGRYELVRLRVVARSLRLKSDAVSKSNYRVWDNLT